MPTFDRPLSNQAPAFQSICCLHLRYPHQCRRIRRSQYVPSPHFISTPSLTFTQPLNFTTAGRTVPLAATRIYQMSFFTGFGVSALVYYVLNRLFPVPGLSHKFEEIDLSNYNYVPGHEEESGSDVGSISSKKQEDLDVKIDTVSATSKN